MVIQHVIKYAFVLIIVINLSACSVVNKLWGEAPPPPKTVTLESTSLPPIENLFDDNEKIAEDTLKAWKTSILDSVGKLRGSNPDRLNMDEVLLLVRVGLVKLDSDPIKSIAKARSALTLLGFKDGISKTEVSALLDWVKINRIQAKSFYRQFIQEGTIPHLNSDNLKNIVEFIGSLIALGGNENLTAKNMTTLLEPWIPSHYIHAKKALNSGALLLNASFSSLCGDRVEKDLWNPQKNGQCLLSLAHHFKDTAPVFDFMFDGLNPFTEREALFKANSILTKRVRTWIEKHHHPKFKTEVVSNFADRLEIPAPYHFFKLTEWIPKLNIESTAQELSPTFFIDVAHVLENWVSTFLAVTENTKENKSCRFETWKNCKFQGEYKPAKQLFNDEYATLIRVDDLNFINKISFFDAISGYLFEVLDTDQDGLLKDDIKELITLAIRLLDSSAFAQNVILRIQEKPLDEINTENSVKDIRRHGLGEVAALASDLIPEREQSDRGLFKQLMAQVYDHEKRPTFALDRLGITTFIYVFDLLSNLRAQYLKDYDFQPIQEGVNTYVKRRKIVEHLPKILHDHFPRIYNECLDWGFERTCGVVFTEVLASPEKGRDDLLPSEMDVISLTAVLLESMIYRCDRNHDDYLSTNIVDGFDEKACVIAVSRSLAQRLMNSAILEDDRTTRILLKALQWVPPARWVAKYSLAKGRLSAGLYAGPASLGSVLSLAGEFMDPDKVEAIEDEKMGPHADPGDELLYHQQLTKKYLPTSQWAKRTSEMALILYGPNATQKLKYEEVNP